MDDALKDVAVAIKTVASAGKVGIVGYCWGGTVVWVAASKLDGLACSASYYGGGIAANKALQAELPGAAPLRRDGPRDSDRPVRAGLAARSEAHRPHLSRRSRLQLRPPRLVSRREREARAHPDARVPPALRRLAPGVPIAGAAAWRSGESRRAAARGRASERICTAPRRRRVDAVNWLAAGVLALFSSLASAQGFPERPVRLIVALPPGGSPDLIARTIAQGLQGVWPQPVVVENRPGASQNIAAELVAKSAPDGYTWLIAPDNVFVVNPHLARQSFDPLADLAPVTLLARIQFLLVVHPSVPAQFGGRAGRLCEVQAGRAQFRLLGHRQPAVPRRHAANPAVGHENEPRAVQGGRAGGGGPAGRPDPGLDRRRELAAFRTSAPASCGCSRPPLRSASASFRMCLRSRKPAFPGSRFTPGLACSCPRRRHPS